MATSAFARAATALIESNLMRFIGGQMLNAPSGESHQLSTGTVKEPTSPAGFLHLSYVCHSGIHIVVGACVCHNGIHINQYGGV